MAVARRLQEELAKHGHQAKIIQTSRESHEFKQACNIIKAETRVVCIGGDGTLLYFLNHCDTFHSVAFYGMGTANVIAIEFEIPKQPEAFAEMLIKGHTLSIRPGLTQDGTRFLMMFSFGIDGMILKKSSQKLKNRLGKLAFFPAAIRAFFRYRFPRLECHLDDGTVVKGSLVIVSRIKHYGGPFNVAPGADPTADFFEIIVLEAGLLKTMLFFLRVTWRASHLKLKYVHRFRSKNVHLTSIEDGYFQLDGDLHLEPVTTLEVADESIPLIVP